MVPHRKIQAAEAMGAIGSDDALPVLRKYLKHDNAAIRETCEIAVDKIVFDNSDAGQAAEPKYASVCPSPLAFRPKTD